MKKLLTNRKNEGNRIRTDIRLDAELRKKAVKRAKKDGVTLTALIERGLTHVLDC